jgi:hypothetical protein
MKSYEIAAHMAAAKNRNALAPRLEPGDIMLVTRLDRLSLAARLNSPGKFAAPDLISGLVRMRTDYRRSWVHRSLAADDVRPGLL